MTSDDDSKPVPLLVDPKGKEGKVKGDGSPKLIGLSNAWVGGELQGKEGLLTSTLELPFGLLITLELDGEEAEEERVNSCCHDFLGAGPRCGSMSTCNEQIMECTEYT